MKTMIKSGAAGGLSRGLTARHIHFIALGSAIGTGLFYGSAVAFEDTSEPASWEAGQDTATDTARETAQQTGGR